jgi:predicted GNAT family N-acyltransferase
VKDVEIVPANAVEAGQHRVVFIGLNTVFGNLDHLPWHLIRYGQRVRNHEVSLTQYGGETMIQIQHAGRHDTLRRLAFSPRIRRCLDRVEQRDFVLHRVARDQSPQILEPARRLLKLASDATVDTLLARNPDLIHVAEARDGNSVKQGIIALLPLNADGVQAVTDGRFSGLSPDPAWISAPGDPVGAIYIWLVHMPNAFGRLLGAMATAVESLTNAPVPIFSRAVNPGSVRVHRTAGLLRARSFFPACAEDLHVVFPEKDLARPKKPVLSVEIARTIEDIFQVFAVRSATYIAEQFCLYSEEFDGNDFCSTHFVGKVDGDAAGCVRLRFFDGFAKLERLAVRAEYRNSRLAYKLVRAALEHCRLKGYRRIYGHSRLDLIRFWRVFGFRPIEHRPEFSFANVRYREILLEQPAHPDAIDPNVDPKVIIRPEGAWDRPGPFDQPPTPDNALRQKLISQRTRTVARAQVVA